MGAIEEIKIDGILGQGLLKKLLFLQSAIVGLSKDKSSTGYQYVSGDKVLDNFKPLMCRISLLLKPEVTSIENSRQDYFVGKGSDRREKSEILSKLTMRMTWIDVESGEREVCEWGANGQNAWDKGVGSAMTYGERYFFLKFFHIETDKDDVDNPDRENNKPENEPTGGGKLPEKTITPPNTKKPIGKKAMTDLLDSISKKETQPLEDAKKIYTFSEAARSAITEALKKASTPPPAI